MMTVLVFFLFLGPLVFIHELGHFVFARIFGVRVEVFSIGFGPKLFKIKRGETEYAFSLIPLGGYIKMFGENPLEKDKISEEDKARSLSHKGKFARFCIVFAGPAFNVIMAFVLFFSLGIVGERLPEMKFGKIPHQANFYNMGVRTGDVLCKVNGKDVKSPVDLSFVDGEIIKSMIVKRGSEEVVISLNMTIQAFIQEFIKYPPLLRKPIIVDGEGDKFLISDRIGEKSSFASFEEMENKLDRYQILYILKAQDLTLVKEITVGEISNLDSFMAQLRIEGFYPIDLAVGSVQSSSPAQEVGIVDGDLIINLNGQDIHSFEDLRNNLQYIESGFVKLSILRKGELKNLALTPNVIEEGNITRKIIGVRSQVEYCLPKLVDVGPYGFIQSLKIGFLKTSDAMSKTFIGYKNLITGKISLKNVGGPISIGKIAKDSFDTSLSYFFQLMALISINLGLINLFPIPVLDGGHILFIGLELLNRKPLSQRKLEIAQMFGFTLLLLLMFAAIYNDISRLF